MAGKSFTRYWRDPAFRAAVQEQFAIADAATEAGLCITYAIHDPTQPDHIGAEPNGLIIYVGETKEFSKRVRKRMRSAGTAVKRPSDRIDGACYDIMMKGAAPKFSVRDRTRSKLESLISETNTAKRLRAAGYPLLNQWTEQKFAGLEIDRSTVPLDWLWPLTASDAVTSGIDVIIHDVETGQEITIDLTTLPQATRLREIRAHQRGLGRRVRLHVQ
jgi:hypothetical protein